MMKNQKQEMFVPKVDYDNEYSRLKEALRLANDAYRRLNSNVDLIALPSPMEVSVKWLTTFIDERVQAVTANMMFDASTTARLTSGWRKIADRALKDVKAVETFVRAHRKHIHTDEASGMMVFNDINALAIALTEKELPDDCLTHLQFIQDIAQSVRKLRQWEKENHVRKKPLEWLLRATEDTLKTEWVKGGMTIDFQQERQEYMGAALWLRKAYEENIV